MHESIELFETISNTVWLRNPKIVLLLNKKDIKKEKVQHSQLADYFPEYEGISDENNLKRI